MVKKKDGNDVRGSTIISEFVEARKIQKWKRVPDYLRGRQVAACNAMACCLAYALPSQVENKLRQAQKNRNTVVRGPSTGMSTWQNCLLTKISAPSLHLLENPPGKRKWLKIRNKERSHTDDHYLESDDGNSLQAFPKCLVTLSQMEQTKFRFLQNIKDLFPK